MSRTWFQRLADWLHDAAYPADAEPSVDVDYLLANGDYRYLDVGVGDDDHGVRCNLCGRLFAIEEAPTALEHVATHDGQGAASVNPFELDCHGAELQEPDTTGSLLGERHR